MRRLALLVALLLAAGCGGSSETLTVTETRTERETVTETVTVEVDPEPEPASYPRGFPKLVPIGRVPDRMVDYAGSGRRAVQLAPGVWAQRTPGTSLQENADFGSYFGWCASVEAFERRFGRSDMSACW